MTAPSKEVGFSPRHNDVSSRRARAEVLEGERADLRFRCLDLIRDIHARQCLIGAGAEARDPGALLAACSKLLDDLVRHIDELR